jgi:SAM-dependent methyltransferase
MTAPAHDLPFAFDSKYDRVRREPSPQTIAYLHLSDIRDGLAPRLAQATGTWLDFGCGTSPYRELLGDAELCRADVASPGGAPVDYQIVPGKPCPAPDESFDGVLSTQVLQHVPDAHQYLSDALRMLRPGGRLVLTAPSAYEEHFHPLDLGRWTRPAMRAALERAGFEVEECVPLTSGERALAQLAIFELGRAPRLRGRTTSAAGILFAGLQLLAKRRPEAINAWAERSPTPTASGFYLGVLATARRPS